MTTTRESEFEAAYEMRLGSEFGRVLGYGFRRGFGYGYAFGSGYGSGGGSLNSKKDLIDDDDS